MKKWDKNLIYFDIIKNKKIKKFHKKKAKNPLKRLIQIIQHWRDTKPYNDNSIIQEIITTYLKKKNLFSIELKEEIEDLYLEQLIFETNTILKQIKYKYSLSFLDVLMSNNKSILIDDEILYLSPILFEKEIWKKIITHELKVSFNYEMMLNKYHKIIHNLGQLEITDLLGVDVLPDVSLDKDDYVNSNLLYYVSKDFDRKIQFLQYLDLDKIVKEKKQDLLFQLKQVNNRKRELENKLKKRQFSLKKNKYYYNILKGLNHLLEKQNLEMKKSLINNISRDIIHNIFYIPKQIPLIEIPISFKMNSKVLLEFLFFIKYKLCYIENSNKSIPKVVSDNLSSKFKGYSYKNLNKIYNEINELNFNNLASEISLKYLMK